MQEIKLNDLIQYRYKLGDGTTSRTVRKVIGFEVDENGKRVYVVEGGYWVKKTDVLGVVPMHESGQSAKSEEPRAARSSPDAPRPLPFALGSLFPGSCGRRVHFAPIDAPGPAPIATPTPTPEPSPDPPGGCNAPCTFNPKTGEMDCPC